MTGDPQRIRKMNRTARPYALMACRPRVLSSGVLRDALMRIMYCADIYFIVYPPSVTRVVPVVKEEASDAR